MYKWELWHHQIGILQLYKIVYEMFVNILAQFHSLDKHPDKGVM